MTGETPSALGRCGVHWCGACLHFVYTPASNGTSSTVHQPTQAFELPVERCAIGRLVASGRWRST
jgi:hypothetical protein